MSDLPEFKPSRQLETFREHCIAMACGAHSPECVEKQARLKSRWGHFCLFREWPEHWGERPTGPPAACPGDCVPKADRDLFHRMASEIDGYLTSDDVPLWEDA